VALMPILLKSTLPGVATAVGNCRKGLCHKRTVDYVRRVRSLTSVTVVVTDRAAPAASQSRIFCYIDTVPYRTE
jgi:hypothetical protein